MSFRIAVLHLEKVNSFLNSASHPTLACLLTLAIIGSTDRETTHADARWYTVCLLIECVNCRQKVINEGHVLADSEAQPGELFNLNAVNRGSL